MLYTGIIALISLCVYYGETAGAANAKDSYLPCILNNGCVCNHSLAYFNWSDEQYYGTCISCDSLYSGPTCSTLQVDCQNFGQKVDGVCKCTPDYTGAACDQHLCLHSEGGIGDYNVTLPNAKNYCANCLDGYTGMNCDMCDSNAGCGPNSTCSKDAMYLFDNHKMLCHITDPSIVDQLEYGGREVAADIIVNCSSPSSWQNADGFCSMSLYREEYINLPDQRYIDPFFFCSALECSASQVNEEIVQANNADRDQIFVVVKYMGMSFLLALCFLVSISRYIPVAKRFQHLPVKISLCLLVTAILVYVITIETLIGTAPTLTQRMVTLHCAKATCSCAPDSRLINATYRPACEQTPFALLLPIITGNIDVVCNADTMACTFQPRDLTVTIPLQCESSECVPNSVIPKPVPNSQTDDAVEIYAFIVGGVLLFVILATIIHYLVCRHMSKKASEEFLLKNQFAPSEPATAAGAYAAGAYGSNSVSPLGSPLTNTVEAQSAFALPKIRKVGTQFENEQLLAKSLTASPGISVGEMGINRHTKTYSAEYMLSQSGMAETMGPQGRSFKPLKSCQLSVEGLNYRVRSQPWPPFKMTEENSKCILFNLSFAAQSGDVIALMGSSGAGKTTFLDILAARGKSGKVHGDMRLNGCCVNNRTHRRRYRNLIGYVSQEDTLLPNLTVRETLKYAAMLKLPTAFGKETIDRVVEDVISSLNLQRCSDTIIGDGQNSRGLSGGEKRRVSIGAELVGNPHILFLDEPTSGLDAHNALNVMEVVAMLAKESPLRRHAPNFFSFNPIIIASIHQPSKAILKRFTKVVLLSRGQMIYSGSVAQSAATVLGQLAPATAASIQDDVEGDDNPAEILLAVDAHITDEQREALAIGARNDENESRKAMETVRDGAVSHRGNIITESIANKRYYMNVYNQFGLLVRRAYASLMGAYYLVAAHGFVALIMGILMCLLYQSEPLSLPGSLNRAGSITFLLLVQSFISLSALEQLMTEKKLFVTERENGYYTTLPYLVSKVVVDIFPLRVIPSVLVGSLIYFPMGLRMDDGTHFLWFVFIVTLFTCTITMIVVCIGAVSNSFGSAALASAVLILWNFVFGGLLVQSQTIPAGFQPFRNISPFYFAFEALMVNELKGQLCIFSPTNDAGQPSDVSMPVFCVQYLYNLGLDPDRFDISVILLAVECIVFVVLAYVMMTFVHVTR